jgi:hypothetical protein
VRAAPFCGETAALDKDPELPAVCLAGADECFALTSKKHIQPSKHRPTIAAALVHPRNDFRLLIGVTSILRISRTAHDHFLPGRVTQLDIGGANFARSAEIGIDCRKIRRTVSAGPCGTDAIVFRLHAAPRSERVHFDWVKQNATQASELSYGILPLKNINVKTWLIHGDSNLPASFEACLKQYSWIDGGLPRDCQSL